MEKAELTLSGIEKKFVNKLIFRDINFTLKNSDSLALTGRNGSGKSTLIKIIAGLLSPTKGICKLSIDDKKTEKEHLYKYIGFIAPYVNLYDELTAFENLEFFSTMKSNGKKADKEYIFSLLDRVNLFNRKNDIVRDFSSGMKQRLKLAFSILNSPFISVINCIGGLEFKTSTLASGTVSLSSVENTTPFKIPLAEFISEIFVPEKG